MKMMRWEEPLTEQLTDLRQHESFHISSMAKIRASIMAIQFSVVSLTSFTTFAVFRSEF